MALLALGLILAISFMLFLQIAREVSRRKRGPRPTKRSADDIDVSIEQPSDLD